MDGVHLLQVVGILLLDLLLSASYLPLLPSDVGPQPSHFGVLLGNLQLVVIFDVIFLVLDIAASSGNDTLSIIMFLRDSLQTSSRAMLLISGIAHLTRDSTKVST